MRRLAEPPRKLSDDFRNELSPDALIAVDETLFDDSRVRGKYD
jgi:hypothetical protein